METVFELLVVPTRTLPKLKLVVLGVSWSVWATPLADKAIVAGEFVALLMTETLPVTLPAVSGVKVMVKLALCPAAKVSGTAKPVAVKPAPDTATCETLTLLLPVFVSTTVCEPLPPTSTLPRFKEVALAESRQDVAGEEGACVEFTPVPDTVTDCVPRMFRLKETVMFPEIVPVAVGWNTT